MRCPTIAWNKLPTSLYKSQSLKLGWDLALVGLGIPTSLLPESSAPRGSRPGTRARSSYDLVISGTSTGRLSDSGVQWLDDHGPDQFLSQITVPTLIAQGTVDTLFTLDEAHRNFTKLKAQGVPVKMMWFCGGHGACLTGSDGGDPLSTITGDGGLVQERKLAWFAKHLKREAVDTGPEFEWIDEDGTWHDSAAYPRPRRVHPRRGQRHDPLTPGVNPSGVAVFATPSALGLKIPVAAPPAGADVVGQPC